MCANLQSLRFECHRILRMFEGHKSWTHHMGSLAKKTWDLFCRPLQDLLVQAGDVECWRHDPTSETGAWYLNLEDDVPFQEVWIFKFFVGRFNLVRFWLWWCWCLWILWMYLWPWIQIGTLIHPLIFNIYPHHSLMISWDSFGSSWWR